MATFQHWVYQWCTAITTTSVSYYSINFHFIFHFDDYNKKPLSGVNDTLVGHGTSVPRTIVPYLTQIHVYFKVIQYYPASLNQVSGRGPTFKITRGSFFATAAGAISGAVDSDDDNDDDASAASAAAATTASPTG
jgi:hypothetical protein